MIPIIINYVLDGLLGSILYILVSKIGYDHRWDIVRRAGIGAISGLVLYYANIPDHLVAVGLGYIGIDAIEAILIKKNLIPKPNCTIDCKIDEKIN